MMRRMILGALVLVATVSWAQAPQPAQAACSGFPDVTINQEDIQSDLVPGGLQLEGEVLANGTTQFRIIDKFTGALSSPIGCVFVFTNEFGQLVIKVDRVSGNLQPRARLFISSEQPDGTFPEVKLDKAFKVEKRDSALYTYTFDAVNAYQLEVTRKDGIRGRSVGKFRLTVLFTLKRFITPVPTLTPTR